MHRKAHRFGKCGRFQALLCAGFAQRPAADLRVIAHHLFDQILPHATTAGDFAYAQIVKNPLATVDRHLYRCQQAFVKTGGIQAVVLIKVLFVGGLSGPDLTEADAVLIAKGV